MTKRSLSLKQPCLVAFVIVLSQWFPMLWAFQTPCHFVTGTIKTTPSFVSSRTNTLGTTRLFDKPVDEAQPATKTEDEVEVGSKDYYGGFLSSPIQDETVAERGSGLEQALKLGGGAVVVLVALVVGFMASNGLL
mmetsp:Transcript_14418/g.33165  ORF Transcript_14418/g.33165 Transcript_14418/m.33165 type:complete len:135 (-) Transcript_14418:1595-1999(-)